MTKSELVATISQHFKTKAEAERALEAVLESIQVSLKKGEDVRIVGFGTFSVSQRAARTGRNPRTGEEIKIPATKTPTFKAGKELKEAVNK
ncbi:MAG: HU family DNA-binding protein [Candidatus Paracaedimonas acanthamoebae]|uniref:HU family DNA-binding protein n=1 Tax=Candidatus Paracaedimonas acanthamoebae TaxID=244581 RepID=A0A8J7PXR9_9PROT|nr:HU family DNA-binding protein [Candidatus Paracaedimonas acanthamoebae]